MSIQVENISKKFGDFTALNNVSLEIPEGELVALLGPSGCGKTSLLRIIAGLEQADAGRILLNGEDQTSSHVREREIGFVFQHYALFRHMTVFDNVAFGLRVKKRAERPTEKVIKEKVFDLLKLVQLDWLADRFPDQLSGGQRQRIALARALAVEPKVLLLDEPFGALDANVRKELRRWLRRLHDELHITSIFVTHDQEEAMEVSSRIVVMNKGVIEQIGTPEQVYEHPQTPFVSRFLGDVNIFHGRVDQGWLDLDGWRVPAPAEAGQREQVAAYVRPHDVELTLEAEPHLPPATVRHIHHAGSVYKLELDVPARGTDETIEVEVSRREFQALNVSTGDTVYIRLVNPRIYPREDAAAVTVVSEIGTKSAQFNPQIANGEIHLAQKT
ncbi:MAG: cysA-2 [Verrucomicrobiaceae bacterium]|nr:cysA-2 [Verrucomicrobiaceae bacterium]